MEQQPRPHPELRRALCEALPARCESFRESVAHLAAQHGFETPHLDTNPDTFELPDPVGTVDHPARRLVWRAWLLEAAPIGVVLTGAAYHDNPLLYANCTTQELTGYSLEELHGENLRLLQGPDTDQATVDTLRSALRGWNSITVEIRNYRTDGTPFTNRVSLIPVPDANGTVEHWFGLQAAVPAD